MDLFFSVSLCDCWVVKLSDLIMFLRKNVLIIVRQHFDRNLNALKA